MGDDYNILREDGYLNVDLAVSSIVYHNNLNLILLRTNSGIVHVLDVNSGVLLQSSDLSSENGVEGIKYINGSDRVFYWDYNGIGTRCDYNGVLLLHSALQRPLAYGQEEQVIRLELLQSEAFLLLQCLRSIDPNSVEALTEVINELENAIEEEKKVAKKGVKAQKWSTVTLEMDQSSLRHVANGVIAELKSQNRRIPALAIASSVAHRANELVPGSKSKESRSLMASESARKETFKKWPHMDYKWALPVQMAQAGFYHQPTSTGDDRAICFTCMVCLVCWEKSDEPSVEHERHSPTCPFIRGEYTLNVPISVSNATNCAVPNSGEKVISEGNNSELIGTGTPDGQITLWKFDCGLKPSKYINLTPYDAIFSGKLTSESNKVWSESLEKDPYTYTLRLTAMSFVGLNTEPIYNAQESTSNDEPNKESTESKPKPKASLICGVTVTRSDYMHPDRPIQENSLESALFNAKPNTSDNIKALNDQNKAKTNFVLNKNLLFLLTYDVHGSTAANNSTNIQKVTATNSNSNKNGGSTKVIHRTIDTDMYDDINYSYTDDETEIPNNFAVMDDQINVINIDAASSSKEISSKFWMPKKITVTKHIKLYPNLHHPIKFSSSINLPSNIEDTISWMPDIIDSTMHDFVEKLAKQKNIMPSIIKVSDQTDANSTFIDTSYMNTNITEPMEISSWKWCDGGDSSDKLKIALNSFSKPSTQSTNVNSDPAVVEVTPEESVPVCAAIQCLILPPQVNVKDQSHIKHLLPTEDGKHLLVIITLENKRSDERIMPTLEEDVEMNDSSSSFMLVYAINMDSSTFTLKEETVVVKELTDNESPIDLCMLPSNASCEHSVAIIGYDGSLRVYTINELKMTNCIKPTTGRFVSLTYCTSVERLSVSTETGLLYFYCLGDADKTISGEKDDDDYDSCEVGTSKKYDSNDRTLEPTLLIADKQQLELDDLNSLVDLTGLYGTYVAVPYNAVVPGFWCELSPAQRPRSDNCNKRTWRLQSNASTWDEHLLELTLPHSTALAHMQLSFKLHQPCPSPPIIQVTLLKQNLHGIGYRKDSLIQAQEDSAVTFPLLDTGNKQSADNPVNSKEYLRAHNAEILAGPVLLSQGMDLTQNSGTLVLTSPQLYRAKGKIFLIHIKTLFDPAKDIGRVGKASETNNKKAEFIGCDWLHQISITVRCCPNTELPNPRHQRIAMLESNTFLNNLFTLASKGEVLEKRHLALDIILWVITVRLQRFRPAKTDNCESVELDGLPMKANMTLSSAELQQIECVKVVEQNVKDLIVYCILNARRSMAKKSVKIILVTSEGIKNLSKPWESGFDKMVLEAIVSCIPLMAACQSPGAMNWLCKLAMQISPLDTDGLLHDSCMKLLEDVAVVYEKRENPYHNLLKARFGLYGLPLESAIFEQEQPLLGKVPSPIVPYGSNNSNNETPQTNAPSYLRMQHDLRDLYHIAPEQEIKPNTNSWWSEWCNMCIDGSLPLHFTCHTSSEGTKLESAAPQPQQDHPTQLWIKVKDGILSMGKQGDSESLKSWEGQEDCLMECDEPANEQMVSNESDQHDPIQEQLLKSNGSDAIWPHVIVPTSGHTLVVERMHSGARRYVVLQLQRDVRLTDVIIPACSDLVSLSIDVWLKDEDKDSIKLIHYTSIATAPLILTDIQPPPLCRFIKITTIGRYGMPAIKCKISLGHFFGTIADIEQEEKSTLETLNTLKEDINCRYRLAMVKLKEHLDPYLDDYRGNLGHMLAYIGSPGEADPKVLGAYEECMELQQQLHLINNILDKLCENNSINISTPEESSEKIKELLQLASTDKLRVIIENLLQMLLYFNFELEEKPWQGEVTVTACWHVAWVSGCLNSMLLAASAVLLSRLAAGVSNLSWWPKMLPRLLQEATQYHYPLPLDRFLLMVILMCRASGQLCDAMEAVSEFALTACESGGDVLLPLTLLAACLDAWQAPSSRWDFVTSGKVAQDNTGNENSNSSNSRVSGSDCKLHRKKLHKKLLHYKNNLHDIDAARRAVLSLHVQRIATLGRQRSSTASGSNSLTSDSRLRCIPLSSATTMALTHALLKVLMQSDGETTVLAAKVLGRVWSICGAVAEPTAVTALLKRAATLPVWPKHALNVLLQDYVEYESIGVSEQEASPTRISHEDDSLLSRPLRQKIISLGEKYGAHKNTVGYDIPLLIESDDSDNEDHMMDQQYIENVRKSKLSKLMGMANSTTNNNTVTNGWWCMAWCSSEGASGRADTLAGGTRLLGATSLQRAIASLNTQTPVHMTHTMRHQSRRIPERPPTAPRHCEILSEAFNEMLTDLHVNLHDATYMENVLSLWITLNASVKSDVTFPWGLVDPLEGPKIKLSPVAIKTLLKALVNQQNLSLRCWVMALQAIAWLANSPAPQNQSQTLGAVILKCDYFLSAMIKFMQTSFSSDGSSSVPMGGGIACETLGTNASGVVSCVWRRVCAGSYGAVVSVQALGAVLPLRHNTDVRLALARHTAIIAPRFDPRYVFEAFQLVKATSFVVVAWMTSCETTLIETSTLATTENTFPEGAIVSGLLDELGVNEARSSRKPQDTKQLIATTLHLCKTLLSLPEKESVHELSRSSETDESKVAASNLSSSTTNTDDDKRPVRAGPCLADSVLLHQNAMQNYLKALAFCQASSTVLNKKTEGESEQPVGESLPALGDVLYLFMMTLIDLASKPEYVIKPLIAFLKTFNGRCGGDPPSESLNRFIERALNMPGGGDAWHASGGATLCVSKVSTGPSITGAVTQLHHYLRVPPKLLPLPPKKTSLAQDLNHLGLVNYAPLCTVTCSNPTARCTDMLLEAGGSGSNATTGAGPGARRVRGAAWGYHFYVGDEVALTLSLTLPHAIRLHEIHLQPHLAGLATCPSAVGVEISCGGTCVPLGGLQPTAGLTFIRLGLTVPTIATTIQIKLYKPRDSSNMGLLNLRILGSPAFTPAITIDNTPSVEEWWLKALESSLRCGAISNCEIERCISVCAQRVVHSPAAQRLLLTLARLDQLFALRALILLLGDTPNTYAVYTKDKEPVGEAACCSLIYYICTESDPSGANERAALLVRWASCLNLESNTGRIAAHLRCVAGALWALAERGLVARDALPDTTLTAIKDDITDNNEMKKAINALLCALCFIRPDFFKMMLRNIEDTLTDNAHQQDRITDDSKLTEESVEYDWSKVKLEELETLQMSAKTPTTRHVFLQSRLLPAAVDVLAKFAHQMLHNMHLPMTEVDGSSDIGFEASVSCISVHNARCIIQWLCASCDDRAVCEWLGSSGRTFWGPLLRALCLAPNSESRNWEQEEEYKLLEEQTIRFFSVLTTVHPTNQRLFADALHEILKEHAELYPEKYSSFTRLLVVRLLLSSERICVCVSQPNPMQRSMPAQHPRHYTRTQRTYSTRTTVAEVIAAHSNQGNGTNLTMSQVEGSSIELTVAAASCAQDKRSKDAANARSRRQRKRDRTAQNNEAVTNICVEVEGMSGYVAPEATLAELCAIVPHEYGPHLVINLVQKDMLEGESNVCLGSGNTVSTCPGLLLAVGSGLSLLATPGHVTRGHQTVQHRRRRKDTDHEWVKLDDIPTEQEGAMTETGTEDCTVPAHSLFALGLLLKLPGYAEALLERGQQAVNLLRLLMAVTDDEDGQAISGGGLGTLPWAVLCGVLERSRGPEVRRALLRSPLLHLIFTSLAVFTHHAERATPTDSQASNSSSQSKGEDKKQLYWAKGTGFGTGSTQQSWNVEQALVRQKMEEEHVTVLLQVIASYIYPGELWNPDNIPPPTESPDLAPEFVSALCSSALIPALCSYLRNDSVLDMSRHIALYGAVVRCARALWACRGDTRLARVLNPVPTLISQMARTTAAYADTLRANKKGANNKKDKSTNTTSHMEAINEEDEGLAALIMDIQATASLMCRTCESGSGWDTERPAAEVSRDARYVQLMRELQFDSVEMLEECSERSEGWRFRVSFALESVVRAAGTRTVPHRMKRLAQEVATLATSLPLSYSSSVFVRTDVDRLDIMKVLITGPADTPYANGCFILDVYFPPDYPNVPMLVNLETTGMRTVRFNPNLYNDGKVCLSVLNTWHGRPEEKWNPHTSSFLQVLVSIQSLILVPEPYFNEPGYERSRGTRVGAAASLEYNANIYQATVRWAMLDHLKNVPHCFREVIHKHFWIKRNEICKTITSWINELENHVGDKRTQRSISTHLMALKRHYAKLQVELAKLQTPEGLEDLEEEFTPTASTSTAQSMLPATTLPVTPTASNTPEPPSPATTESTHLYTDQEMEMLISQVVD